MYTTINKYLSKFYYLKLNNENITFQGVHRLCYIIMFYNVYFQTIQYYFSYLFYFIVDVNVHI